MSELIPIGIHKKNKNNGNGNGLPWTTVNFEFTGSKLFNFSQAVTKIILVKVDNIPLNGDAGAPIQYRLNSPFQLEILDEMIVGEDNWVSVTYNYGEINEDTPGPIAIPTFDSIYKGAIVPTSPAPGGTGVATWSATQAGTYTNFGGVVVNANSLATISRNAAGGFAISQTALDFTFVKQGIIYKPLIIITELQVGFITNSGAASGIDNNWRRTDFIPISEGKKIHFKAYQSNGLNIISFYNVSKIYISGVAGVNIGGVNLVENDYTVPAGASFVRFSFASPTNIPIGSTYYSEASGEYAINERFNSDENRISNLEKGNTPLELITNSTEIANKYINLTGILSAIDTNWTYTSFFSVIEGDKISVKMNGNPAIRTYAYYDSAYNYISGYSASASWQVIDETITIPSGVAYVRFSYASQLNCTNNGKIYYHSATKQVITGNELNRIEGLIGTKTIIPIISPYKVYTVCNNIIPTAKGHNRNYSASIYIDHFFDGLTSEKNIRINKTKSDKFVFRSPIIVTDSNEANPTVIYNEGINVLTKSINLALTGTDIVDIPFTVQHTSTLASVTSNIKPRVLCIGDSISYGELAVVNDDNQAQNYAYHLMCQEFFKRDNIDNGGIGHDCLFLGQFTKTRNMSYNGTTYPIKTHHEGIRGISLTAYLNGSVAAFKSPTTNKFSIDAWLNQYRTMDNTGARLTLGSGTGSLITSGNLTTIDVCLPTHVLIMLGANGGGTLAQYQEMVTIIKTEYPNMIIGFAIPDAAGTYFPSLHPNLPEDKVAHWNNTDANTSNQGSRHSLLYGLQKMLQNEYANSVSEAANIYTLPFFYVAPTAESFSMRKVNSPDAVFELTRNNQFNDSYGWAPSTHINGIGHTNWGYQLYAWLKYTMAKNI